MKDFVLVGHKRKRKERAEKWREGVVEFYLFTEIWNCLQFLMDLRMILSCQLGELSISHCGMPSVTEWWSGMSKRNWELVKWGDVFSCYLDFSIRLFLVRFHCLPLSDSLAVSLNLSSKFSWWLFSLLSSVNVASNQYCKWDFMFKNYWISVYESA